MVYRYCTSILAALLNMVAISSHPALSQESTVIPPLVAPPLASPLASPQPLEQTAELRTQTPAAGTIEGAPVEPVAQLSPIDLAPFGSSISHWRNLKDDRRFIHVLPDQESYEPTQVREIIENILLYQRANGGWPKDYDMTAILTPEQRETVIATRDRSDTSYDNNNLFSQVEYLARAVEQLEDPRWRSACERGLDFMLESQYEHGGFPQRFPDPHSYHAHITFNDGVMIGILRVLNDAAVGAEHFQWLDASRRQRAKLAVRRGIDCILRCQIQVAGKLTGWCQQHDEQTFEARPARTFELASICPQETTEICRFLMSQSDLSPATKLSIESASQWLQRVQLSGLRVEKIAAPPVAFLRHDVDFDIVVVNDPQAPPLWARHYEIGTDRPIFAGRDGVLKYELKEIERERRTGTLWYGHWPARLLQRELAVWLESL